ncbi:Tigger transposable element-derived protein 4 [Nymphon striatum]|nr:Tigger transposable element-derived protein 4 [Nymphon striatum]
MAAKRKFLSLDEKLKAINLLEKGSPAYKVAEEFGVGKTQIQNLRKRKCEVFEQVERNVPLDTKRRRRATGNEEINQLTYEWFKDAVSRRVPVTGPLLQTKALDFASQLNVSDFKASKGWLQSFNRRHNVVFGTMSGERGDVNNQTVCDYVISNKSLICLFACRVYNVQQQFIFIIILLLLLLLLLYSFLLSFYDTIGTNVLESMVGTNTNNLFHIIEGVLRKLGLVRL